MAILLLFLAGCQFNPYASEFTKVQPDKKDLPGRYTPDAETRERLASALNIQVSPNCELVLRSDGTYDARNFPEELARADFSGRWRLMEANDRWLLSLDGHLPNIRGDEPPYIIHFTIGDPDSGNALALARSGPPGTGSAPSAR